MYYPNDNEKCVKVTATCSVTNGEDQVCIECSGKKKGDNCDEDRTVTPDPNCYGNKKDHDKRNCTNCGPCGIVFDAFYGAQKIAPTINNCNDAIDPVTKLCNQCKEGYQLIKNNDDSVPNTVERNFVAGFSLSFSTTVRQLLGEDFRFNNSQLTEQTTLRDILAHQTGIPSHNAVRYQSGLDRHLLAK